jgi:hypothetical protein
MRNKRREARAAVNERLALRSLGPRTFSRAPVLSASPGT